jgi:hypothetical protein
MKIEWDSGWVADSLDGDDEQKFEALVARLIAGEDPRQVAKEIFKLGYRHGYDVCTEVSNVD